jgi:hypothetical protein
LRQSPERFARCDSINVHIEVAEPFHYLISKGTAVVRARRARQAMREDRLDNFKRAFRVVHECRRGPPHGVRRPFVDRTACPFHFWADDAGTPVKMHLDAGRPLLNVVPSPRRWKQKLSIEARFAIVPRGP